MRAIGRFFGRLLACRAAHALFVTHLCLVIFAFADKPAENPPDYDCAPGLETNRGLLAGRTLHFSYESPLLKTLLILDIPSMIPSALLGPPVESHFCDYAASWVAALILLFFSSAQWWLIGYWIECAARAVKRQLP